MQIAWLLLLALPIACVSWTFTHEELFKEAHDYFITKSKRATTLVARKFFYLLTCEYCFSHYVTIAFLAATGFQLLMGGWQGYLIAGFALVWIANVYMSLYAFLRVDLKKERLQTTKEEKKLEQLSESRPNGDTHNRPDNGGRHKRRGTELHR